MALYSKYTLDPFGNTTPKCDFWQNLLLRNRVLSSNGKTQLNKPNLNIKPCFWHYQTHQVCFFGDKWRFFWNLILKSLTHYTKGPVHLYPPNQNPKWELKGSNLGPVHVEILRRVQKLDKTKHISRFQRVQYSCALDPSLFRIKEMGDTPICVTR